MPEPIGSDLVIVKFAGAQAGPLPLTWGQQAILADMRESGNQFSMPGRIDLPEGSTVRAAAARVSGLMSRDAALRVRLSTDSSGRAAPGGRRAGPARPGDPDAAR